jgi:hypothetical protein
MADRALIREVIVGAAEGATEGVAALRVADPAARLEGFEVEVRCGTGDGPGSSPGVTTSIRFAIDLDPDAGPPADFS